MRLWSTPESVSQGEPTVLAIVETLAAMGASIWIGVHFGTWKHVFAGFCIAPFLLLRTDESCEQAILWFHKAGTWYDPNESILNVLYWIIVLVVGGPIVRFAATVSYVAKHPIVCLTSIPVNWRRIVFATDFAASPEYLPLPINASPSFIAKQGGGNINVICRTYDLWTDFFTDPIFTRSSLIHKLGLTLAMAIIFCPMSLTAIAYRWSIKSTAIGWFPLVWGLKPNRPHSGNWEGTLRADYKKGWVKLVAVISLCCITLLLTKYSLWVMRYEIAMYVEPWNTMFRDWEAGGGWKAKFAISPLADGLLNFIRPGAIPLWHVAVFVNAILGILAWWKVRSWVIEFACGLRPADRLIERTLNVIYFFRHILLSYVVLCDGYIFWQMARNLPLPVIGTKLFPWL